jgi:metal-sulfur cluster biosynthetic enzyme
MDEVAPQGETEPAPRPPLNEASVLDALREVVDPEIGINLVDLGLIYSIDLQGRRVSLKMTLTTPGCPMHESLARGAQTAVLRLEGVDEAHVEVVWDPPWHPSMMSPAARAQMGIR